MRFDVPAVGCSTVESLKRAGGRVLAIEAGKTIIFDQDETVALADRYGISIVALCYDGAARPGLYIVVTGDLDEMRRALLEGPLTPCNTPGRPCVWPLASGRNVAVPEATQPRGWCWECRSLRRSRATCV